jgi:hypothetical protein
MEEPVPDLMRQTGEALFRATLYRKLEALGLERVMYDLVRAPEKSSKRSLAIRDWIGSKRMEASEAQRLEIDRAEREARLDDAANESLRIARSAKNASWFAAIVAASALVVAGYAALREFPVSHGGSPAAAPDGAQGGSSRELQKSNKPAK